MIHPAVAAFEYHLVSYRRTWRGTVFSSFVMPVLFLLGMGWSVGGYIDTATDGSLGASYLTYLAPGMLASTAFQVGVGEATYPVLGAFIWTRTYHMMRASPLTTTDILLGHLGYVLFRVALSSAGFVVVMALFGTVHGVSGALALPAAILTGFSLTAFIFAFSASIPGPELFALVFRLLVVPMSLFAGVFFPVSQMPEAARAVAYVSPLWHGVELCRSATLGVPSAWGAVPHTGYLLLWVGAGLLVARRVFARQLTD